MFKRIQQLLRHLAIYGLGDAAPALVSFLLLRVYTNYLTTADYGVIGLLLTVEAVTRVLFRWGTDGAFMRLFYDCRDDGERQRLTSTLLLFLTATNGALLVLGFAATPRIGRYLFEGHAYDGLIRLVIFNTFLTTFHFFPNSLLRIREQSGTFALLTSAKSIATIVVRLLLVVPLRWGVAGVVLADTFVTVAFTIIMAFWVLPLLRPVFSRRVLREALRFGLPRVPHALAHQVIAVSDRYLMAAFLTLGEIGLYGVGSSFGQALKMFLNGFEFAWAPFYYGAMDRSDAKLLYSRLGTYLFAAVVLLAAGLSAVATDLVRLMTAPEFHRAAIVIPWTAMGVVAQACYQVAALGLNVTKRTKYFPISTGAAAAFSIGANLLLIPRYGLLGAAWANAASYTVLTLTIGWFSYREYPIRYEWRRLGLVAAAGLASYAAARWLVPTWPSPLLGLLVRGGMVAVMFPALLWVTGFVEPAEWRRLAALKQSLRGTIRLRSEANESVEMGGEIVADLSGRLDPDGQRNTPAGQPRE
ncbi:MAG: polysaccharide biosynthesis C-terminal domain-containing protein [Vicinamibacterales bacterium]|nr:polysaccharide biosynthesis C-terminal domain-containing protein [Vicinamibacterales bacterium]